ncbi:hypothetical protein C5B42_05415 [Candidatus Cerribacteria bacterium 'Amazon FNV 2010 28 9']|uniref:Uncharacterized protein n=1 Tax=Candidatus Cerribacteria bacterium 'Amazon FNV 2010 28 9' TaxID=2081795 RepID=A0A317JNS8_9BACT|nr:MAG: hypothetical protein C5B42_05415 [Candidatus Cerribacteria bacterium 'Amazon FNV 2010 28 9']
MKAELKKALREEERLQQIARERKRRREEKWAQESGDKRRAEPVELSTEIPLVPEKQKERKRNQRTSVVPQQPPHRQFISDETGMKRILEKKGVLLGQQPQERE